ncbi:membrane protein [Pseudohyphozyma bogoriensis]|nr:membrane protein [Pseudohyphozyma bogoriensis]
MPPLLTSVGLFKAGAALAATGISAGAFGAHALGPRLGEKVATWNTASTYAFVNGVALLALSQHPVAGRKWAGSLITVGTCMFSGSIFALLLFRNKVGKIAGPITPLGGSLMILGYASLLF